MHHPVRNLLTDWRKDDGQKLAVLEMEADGAWPGGGGWQTTAEEQEREYRESDLLGAFVTENASRIISICTINAKPGQHVHTYIPYLNCHPDFHGQRHGKSVLWAAVEHAYQAGFVKVDLNTWPGNLRAVPLYKKMGFMWEPDSSVRMENFTPTARKHPLGKAFFEKYDWYDNHERAMTLEEDVMWRGKVKVYEYIWRAADGAFLRMVFDRQSWGIIEVENNELMAACNLPDENLVAGIPHTVRWKIVNKKPEPVPVFFSASGDPGVEIEEREMLEVRDEVEVERTFLIDANIEEKKEDPKAQMLKTDLLIGGVGVALRAGMRVRQAVSVLLDGPRSILRPEKAQDLALTLRSNLEKATVARVSVAPAGGVMVKKQEHRVKLDAKGGAELVVPLAATHAGYAALDVAVTAGKEKVETKTKRIDLLAVMPGGMGGAVGEDHAFVCAGGLMLWVHLKNGETSVFHRLRGVERTRRLNIHGPRLGPPFAWDEFFEEKCEASVEQNGHELALRLRTRSILRPGVTLDRRIVMGQGPIVRVVDTVVNGSRRVYELSLQQGFRTHLGQFSDTVAPRPQGFYRDTTSRTGGRGFGGLKLPKEGDAWPEGWICVEREDGCAVGLLWDRVERVETEWGTNVRQQVGRLKPGQSKTLDPVYAFVGDGNWRTVRCWWHTLVGDGTPEMESCEVQALKPIQMTVTPNPVLVANGAAKATVSLWHVGEHKLDGKLTISPPAGLKADVRSVEVKGVCETRKVRQKVGLQAAKRRSTGPKSVDVVFDSDEAVYRSNFQVLTLPSRTPEVRVTRQDGGKVLAIDNGIFEVKVAPEFMGSVISLQKDGKEYLDSLYPEAGIRGWMNPCHGGICPHYYRLWSGLEKERFRGRVMKRKGKQGLVWQGVRVWCKVAQERARGQSIGLEYLLAPGVDVMAVLLSCKNELGIRSNGQLGMLVFPSFAAGPNTGVFYSANDSSVESRVASHWFQSGRGNSCGVVGKNGQGLLACGHGEWTHAVGESHGETGSLLELHVERRMGHDEKVEGLFFVGPCKGMDEVKEREVWHKFDALP